MTPSNAVFSTLVRAGKATYFIDIREAKNGNRYLSIAESRLEGEERKRTQIRIFGESIDPFRQAVNEAVGVIAA